MQAIGTGRHCLVERESELAAIEDAIHRCATGSGALLLMRGPAGIGKSSLLRAAERSADAHGLLVLRARAAPFERAFPYGVVRQLFEPILALGEPPPAELFQGAAGNAQQLFVDQPGTQLAADPSFASLHALYWLTSNVASRTPVLVSVDDVIWCDDASLRFLEFLARRLEAMPLTLAFTYRTGEAESAGMEALAAMPVTNVLEPTPLSLKALGPLLAAELGLEADSAFSSACLEATGGNPLLITELVRALHLQGVRPVSDQVNRVRQVGAVAVGPAVQRRFAVLGHRVQAVAQAASILGETVRRDDLATTTSLTSLELDEALAALVGAALVRPGEQISFVHPLVADAVRGSLSPTARARLHDSAVRSLSARGATAWELAPHIVAGTPRAQPDATQVLREAAQWSLSAGAPEAAVTYLRRALEELDGDDPAPLLLDLGRARVQAGDPDARADLARAVELARDVTTRCAARMALSVVLFAAGEAARSIHVLDEGLDEVAVFDVELAERMEGYLLSNLEAVYPSQVNFPDIVRARVTGARARKSRSTPSSRLVLCALAFEELMGGGSASDVVRLAKMGLDDHELLRAEGPMCMPLYRAVVALAIADELDFDATTLTAAIAEAHRLGSPTAFVWASAWRSGVNLRRGHLVEAEADAQAALETHDLFTSGYGQSMARLWLAGVLAEQGRFDEARDQLALVPEPEPPSMVTQAMIESRFRLHLLCRDYEAAWRDFTLYRRLDEPTIALVDWRKPASGGINARVFGARALIGLGDLVGARALIEEELALARALGTHRAVGMALRVAGLIEKGDAQIRLLRSAAEELAQSQSRLEYGWALYDYGSALRRSNHRSDARRPLEGALTIARHARAAPLRDSAAEDLKAAGWRVSRPAASGIDALTASEHRIASMAAAGMSNRDIAQALFVTVKTVETHLGHVYDKLGLTRRADLGKALEYSTSVDRAGDAP